MSALPKCRTDNWPSLNTNSPITYTNINRKLKLAIKLLFLVVCLFISCSYRLETMGVQSGEYDNLLTLVCVRDECVCACMCVSWEAPPWTSCRSVPSWSSRCSVPPPRQGSGGRTSTWSGSTLWSSPTKVRSRGPGASLPARLPLMLALYSPFFLFFSSSISFPPSFRPSSFLSSLPSFPPLLLSYPPPFLPSFFFTSFLLCCPLQQIFHWQCSYPIYHP